jgi:2-polyprenyl-3-methyl-5-hydroxy-6-metoxy-1,4-benzoquinol methylase
MLILKCPLCKSKGTSLPNLPLHAYCPSCKLAWVKNFHKPTYEDNYYKGALNIASIVMAPISSLFYLLRNAYVGLKTKNLWIDVGAGDGGFLKTVRARKKIGVEVSASGRKMMEKAGLSSMTDKQFLKTKNLNADVISFWHVLEHIENPWDYLASARRNLARGGRIVIGVPNIDCLEYHVFGKHWFHTPKFHIWENTPHSIRLLLTRAGFRVQSVDYWSIEHHLPCLLQTFINASAGSQGALHRLIRRGHDSDIIYKDIFWSFFWMTIGFPLVLVFWITGALTHKSGTFVVVGLRN